MFEFIRMHQLNIMVGLSSICIMIAFFVALTKTIRKRRRITLIFIELSAAALMSFDRLAYLFRGVETIQGYYMVRISNFMVYAVSMLALYAFNTYLADLLLHEGGLEAVPKRIKVVDILFAIGELMLILSQFTGWYYTFDSTNHYQRGPAFLLCYMMPLLTLLIQLSIILQCGKQVDKRVRVSLFLFTIVPLIATAVQLFSYGLSLTNISLVGMCVFLYVMALLDANDQFSRANEIEINHLQEKQASVYRLFEQTATAFVGAIDAKDKYSKGHSARVAKYARKVAELDGKDEEECRKVYYAALLHEVGKIGVPDSILSKDSALTDEEYAKLKQYPYIGKEILSNITEFPYLTEGAYYHHERYDGTGYPEGLRGDNIPEIARIIAVADAYDTMTSQQSYREAMPSQKVREEFVKGTGTQFDPKYAKTILRMIDLEYETALEETEEVSEFTEESEITCGEYRSMIGGGVWINANKITVEFDVEPKRDSEEDICMPAMVVFDSLDQRVHTRPKDIENLCYLEYGEIWFDGHTISSASRNLKMIENDKDATKTQKEAFENGETIHYTITAVRSKDHALITVSSKYLSFEVIMALADSVRYSYMGFTGEHCHIKNVKMNRSEEEIDENYIPRIASEVTFINRLEGDIPNLQVNGYRTDATEGIVITDGMELSFHAMSLPTARLVWHCPFINLFYSDDRIPLSPSYREYALIRLDGENWEEGGYAVNETVVKKSDEFEDWEKWKRVCKEGFDVNIIFRKRDNKITTITDNNGIYIKTVTTIKEKSKFRNAYVSLSGDQVALTDIRIRR